MAEEVMNEEVAANPADMGAGPGDVGDMGGDMGADAGGPPGGMMMVETVLGLQPGTLMGMLSADDDVRNQSIAAVTGVLTNLNTVVNNLRPGIETSSATVMDLLGGLLSTVLGRLGQTVDADGNAIPFPDLIDGSTGLTRILGEIGKFLKNFDLFAESITGEARENEMAKLFIRNMDNLMGGALSWLNLLGDPEEE